MPQDNFKLHKQLSRPLEMYSQLTIATQRKDSCLFGIMALKFPAMLSHIRLSRIQSTILRQGNTQFKICYEVALSVANIEMAYKRLIFSFRDIILESMQTGCYTNLCVMLLIIAKGS
jgi:hypothetical protein